MPVVEDFLPVRLIINFIEIICKFIKYLILSYCRVSQFCTMSEFSAEERVNGRRMKVFLEYERCCLGFVRYDVSHCLCRVSSLGARVDVPVDQFVKIDRNVCELKQYVNYLNLKGCCFRRRHSFLIC